MSGTIVAKSSQLYSPTAVIENFIANNAIDWIDFSDSTKYTTTGTGVYVTLSSVTNKGKGSAATIVGSPSFDQALKSAFNLSSTTSYFTTPYFPDVNRKTETMFMVTSISSTSAIGYLAYAGATSTRVFRTGSVMSYGGSATLSGITSLPTGKVVILTVISDDLNGSNAKLYYNGKFEIFGNATYATATATSTSYAGSSAGSMSGNLFEAIAFDVVLSEDYRMMIEYYLAQKWKVTSTLSSPTSISGCTLWLDGNDTNTITYSSGSNISQWADKSGNNYHAVQNTAARQPTYDPAVKGVNFVLASIQFLITSSPYSSVNDETVYVVFKHTGGSNCCIIGTSSSANSGRQVRVHASRMYVYNSVNTVFTGMLVPTNELHVFEYINTSAGTIFNVDKTINGYSATKTSYSAGNLFEVIGATRSTGSNPYDGIIYEVVKFNRILTGSERASILNYLYAKWNIDVGPTIIGNQYRSLPPFRKSFSPTDLVGCQLWLDAADRSTLTLTNSNVTTWKDKSGFQRDATGFGNTTLTTIGNNTAITLDGSTTNFTGLITNTSQSLTVIALVVMDSTAPASLRLISFGNPDSTNTANIVALAGGSAAGGYPRSFYATRNSVNYNSTIGFNYDTPIIGVFRNNRVAYDIYTNGTRTYTFNDTSVFSFNYTVYTISKTSASTTSSPSSVWKGKIGEIIVFNRSLPLVDVQQVESYLALKWGISKSIFSSTHTFKSELALSLPFDPRKLNCVMWLDANDPTSFTYPNGSFQWNDKGSNYNFTTGTGLVTPQISTIPYRNMGCVNFVYYDNQLVSTVNNRITGNVSRSIFMVCNLFGVDSIITMGTGTFSTATTATAFGTGMDMSPGGWLIWAPYIYTANDNVFSAALTGTHFTYSYRDIAAGTIGGGYDFTGYTTKSVSLNTTAGPWYLGRRPDGAGSLNGGICELIVFPSVLSDSDRQKVEGYLAWKWGIQGFLPSTHAYKKYAP